MLRFQRLTFYVKLLERKAQCCLYLADWGSTKVATYMSSFLISILLILFEKTHFLVFKLPHWFLNQNYSQWYCCCSHIILISNHLFVFKFEIVVSYTSNININIKHETFKRKLSQNSKILDNISFGQAATITYTDSNFMYF